MSVRKFQIETYCIQGYICRCFIFTLLPLSAGEFKTTNSTVLNKTLFARIENGAKLLQKKKDKNYNQSFPH